MIIKDMNLAVYIPTAFNVAITRIEKLLSTRYGGVTSYKTEGAWVDDDDGELVKEPVTIIRSWYSSKEHLSQAPFLIDMAANLRDTLKESCIAVEVEGEMVLV